MDYDEIDALRRLSPAWRLLRADNAALVLSFLGCVFVDENVREISATALIGRLDDELYALNERLGAGSYPKPPKAYLDDWAAAEAGWLRKYYPAGSDEAHFDATPALEQAVAFLASLRVREFVGTESRLNTLFDLLRQMAYGTETDPARRLEDLRRQREALDAEIERVERGEFDVLDPSAQRDRFQQFAATARELLADFRQVEANFRELDRELRVSIASWNGAKGELLDEVLSYRGSIAESDQGKSFGAFYDFLLSSDRQAEFSGLLDHVLSLEALNGADLRLRHIHFDWLAAGEQAQATVRMLSEQLRRFLDDRVWLENRRIVEVLRSIETRALELRAHLHELPGADLDEPAPRVGLPMERRMYVPKRKAAIDSTGVRQGDADFESAALFEQVYVDREEVAGSVREALASRAQVVLSEIIQERPLQRGLAELVTYLSLSDDTFSVVFDEHATERVSWDDGETTRVATVPRVSYVRGRSTEEAGA